MLQVHSKRRFAGIFFVSIKCYNEHGAPFVNGFTYFFYDQRCGMNDN